MITENTLKEIERRVSICTVNGREDHQIKRVDVPLLAAEMRRLQKEVATLVQHKTNLSEALTRERHWSSEKLEESNRLYTQNAKLLKENAALRQDQVIVHHEDLPPTMEQQRDHWERAYYRMSQAVNENCDKASALFEENNRLHKENAALRQDRERDNQTVIDYCKQRDHWQAEWEKSETKRHELEEILGSLKDEGTLKEERDQARDQRDYYQQDAQYWQNKCWVAEERLKAAEVEETKLALFESRMIAAQIQLERALNFLKSEVKC